MDRHSRGMRSGPRFEMRLAGRPRCFSPVWEELQKHHDGRGDGRRATSTSGTLTCWHPFHCGLPWPRLVSLPLCARCCLT